MAEQRKNEPQSPEDARRDSGLPGGGAGRTDKPGHTGVYPGSGPWPEGDAPIVAPGSFGQGERGPEGYNDAGDWSPEVFEKVRQHEEEEEQKGRSEEEEKKREPKG